VAVPKFRVELHSHCKGDPIDWKLQHSIFEHIDRAKEVGLDAIAITWHRKICTDEEAFAYGRKKGVLVIPGMEAEIDRRHLVVMNLVEGDLPGETTWNQIRALRLRKPEVLVMAPHPFYPHPSCLGATMEAHVDCIDAVEWCRIHVKWLPGRVNPNLRASRWAHRHGKPLVACSDAHTLASIGTNASTVEADALTAESLFAGIRAGRVTFHRKALDFGVLVHETAKAMSSQPKHIGRWVKAKVKNRRRDRSNSPSGAPELSQ
jgi:predicted metal-dependent phosphoesterase TrpH